MPEYTDFKPYKLDERINNKYQHITLQRKCLKDGREVDIAQCQAAYPNVQFTNEAFAPSVSDYNFRNAWYYQRIPEASGGGCVNGQMAVSRYHQCVDRFGKITNMALCGFSAPEKVNMPCNTDINRLNNDENIKHANDYSDWFDYIDCSVVPRGAYIASLRYYLGDPSNTPSIEDVVKIKKCEVVHMQKKKIKELISKMNNKITGPLMANRYRDVISDMYKAENTGYVNKSALRVLYNLIGEVNPYTRPVDGKYTPWSAWSTCSKSCGGGTQTRSRDYIPAIRGGNELPHGHSDLNQSQACNTQECHIDGSYTPWSAWGKCSKKCGGGTQTRSRLYNAAKGGGRDLPHGISDLNQSQACNTQACPVNGSYGPWSTWSTCSKSCGGGTQTRHRIYTPPKRGGRDLPHGHSDLSQSQACNTQGCPIDGYFTPWEAWSKCSKKCDGGTQTRVRSYYSAANGGRDIPGSENMLVDRRSCNTQACNVPVDGSYGSWSAWSKCSKKCGGGTQSRNRVYYGAENGGRELPSTINDLRQTQSCNTQACSVDGSYGPWSAWGTCSKSCGGGTQTRHRTYNSAKHGGRDLPHEHGDLSQSQACNTQSCDVSIDGSYGSWSAWGECSKKCGGGTQMRTRTYNPAKYGGRDLPHDFTYLNQIQACNKQACPIDGHFTPWGAWGECSKKCGGGTQMRTRTYYSASNGGHDIPGNENMLVDHQKCNTQACDAPVNGKYTPWTAWTPCSKLCGGGTHTRHRTYIPPKHGGRDLPHKHSDLNQSLTCNTQACPKNIDVDYHNPFYPKFINGDLLIPSLLPLVERKPWSEWSTCRKFGTLGCVKTRTRELVLNHGMSHINLKDNVDHQACSADMCSTQANTGSNTPANNTNTGSNTPVDTGSNTPVDNTNTGPNMTFVFILIGIMLLSVGGFFTYHHLKQKKIKRQVMQLQMENQQQY